jgi:hypothetical protein
MTKTPTAYHRPPHNQSFSAAAILAAAWVLALAMSAVAAADVDFNRDIRPILSDNCFFCHGPDPKERQADLRLDVQAGLAEKRGGQRVVEPGKPHQSELFRRITTGDESERMPPADSHKKLKPAQIALIKRWIEEGGVWKQHWAYEPLKRPTVPSVREWPIAPLVVPPSGGPGAHNANSPLPPEGGTTNAPVKAIDCFILARLDQEKLSPSPDADPATLARRLSFDVTGLPPAPEEVRAFEQQARTNPQAAVEAIVDRLLASPHYGERMAVYWLDLVRYADTVGYHGDQEHAISPYRDYVIKAFNDNLPFDRFTLEQLAGDLLPQVTVDQKIATGYNRVLQTSHEGGVQKKEYLAKYSADRVRNFGSVWLGATLGCAECHDHKFDPITQRDFYSLAAFFADVNDELTFKGGDTTPTKREPEIVALSPIDRERLEHLEARLKELQSQPDRAAEPGANASPAQPDPPREAERESLEKQIAEIKKRERRTMVTVAIEPRPIRVLARGDWMDESGQIVEPAVPHFLPQIASQGRATRLDLARWMVARDNPLTARVFVNRLWKLFFGKGLSNRLDDLGAQGEPPSHPELLDWLAAELIESGWDVKHMVRLIVTSRTYRQSSRERPELRERDPENRLLARQSSWRLDAEFIRDNALAASGLLVREIGGPSARPYQPAGYYEFLNFPKRDYKPDSGPSQYRRGLYTHWQRVFLHPMLKAFDAPSREECTAQRPASNTPSAALVLLNDPSFLEAGRVFAARILREGGDTFEERLKWAWRVALSRAASEREAAVLRNLYECDLAEYRADPAAAKQVLAIGLAAAPVDLDAAELAAWTSVARAIFNLNAFITRS